MFFSFGLCFHVNLNSLFIYINMMAWFILSCDLPIFFHFSFPSTSPDPVLNSHSLMYCDESFHFIFLLFSSSDHYCFLFLLFFSFLFPFLFHFLVYINVCFYAQFGVDMVCPLPSSSFSPKWYAAANEPPIAPAIAIGLTPATRETKTKSSHFCRK